MTKTLRALALTAIAGALTLTVPASALPPGTERYNKNFTTAVDCEDSQRGDSAGTITIVAPEKLWPPNHRYFEGSVTATDEDSGDSVTLALEGTHDQYDGEGNEITGSGNTADDFVTEGGNPAQTKTATGEVKIDFKVRAERSGRIQEGRTYTVNWQAMFTDSDNDNSSEDQTTCTGSFTMHVPHDMRPSNR